MRLVIGIAVPFSICAIGGVMAGSGCRKADLQGAKAEVQETSIKLDLPAVPEFAMPQANADGTNSVAGMRLKGNKFLDTETRVKGYVVWIYDCATAIRTPQMTDKEVAKILENEPERCSRPHFTLGDKPDTPPDRGIWVVDVPRAPRKDDKLLGPEIYAQMEAEWKALPPFKLGDEVTVTGTWALLSPKGFRHSDGLLVYRQMNNNTAPVAPGPGAPGAPTAPGGAPPAPGGAPAAPQKAPGAPQK
jgi:hypothetical protein